jgi:hypothetical protein
VRGWASGAAVAAEKERPQAGRQGGHEGKTLAQVARPDRESRHEAVCCGRCGAGLAGRSELVPNPVRRALSSAGGDRGAAGRRALG